MAEAKGDEDKQVEIWKVKKLIKSLEAARGCVDRPGRWARPARAPPP